MVKLAVIFLVFFPTSALSHSNKDCFHIQTFTKMSSILKTHLICVLVCTLWTFFWLADAKGGYAVAIDTGSSSTKLKIYTYCDEVESSVPRIKLNYSETFLPALSSIANNLSVVGAYFENISFVIKANVPTNLLSDTPVYLWATGGLRLLSKSSDEMKSIITILRNSPLKKFRLQYVDSEILSGEEEAAYSWVAANYLLGCFDFPDRPFSNFHGVIEMGGKSTQIAFMPKGSILSGEFHVSINGRVFKLYAHSYLQYGIDGLPIRVAEALKKFQHFRVLKNPCMIQGDHANVTLESNDVAVMNGTGNVAECLQILHGFLDPSQGMDCEPKPCAVGPVYQASVASINFYATQGFKFVPQLLNALKIGTTTLDLCLLKTEGEKYCQKSMSQQTDTKFASSNCLLALFMSVLFETSYGFTTDTSQISVTSNINDQPIEWSLGAVLVHLLRERRNETSAYYVKRAMK
ncbi:hypothetical protein Btru_047307 [Bulinus truncatus]|nr:hypothetical protein Btru_047307 [Bulinus truncatus]